MTSISERRPVRAAVLNTPGHLDLETLWVDAPGLHEIRIRPVSVGLCHSDLHYIDGTHRTHLPEVLGHEAAGVVEQVGDQVTAVKVGDHVVTSLTMFCGRCRYCVTGRMSLCSERAALRHRPRPSLVDSQGDAVGVMGGIGAFAELAVMHENAAIAVPPTLPMPVASLFGCAVLTGVGAVTRAARVPVGATVAVVGCGGIGLAAVQGAVLSGASRILAVDLSSTKLDAARSFGATDVLISDERTVDRSREVLPEGVDFTFEAVGRAETAELAFALLAPGGTCTVLGMVPDETPIHVPPSELYFEEKKLQGAFIGSSRFTTDIPELVRLYEQGRLHLEEMITRRYPLDAINDGFAALTSTDALRIVLDVQSA
jgi:S-(hydroxymethyl)glutathione dehydrogenase / alcohol dehydrogenase